MNCLKLKFMIKYQAVMRNKVLEHCLKNKEFVSIVRKLVSLNRIVHFEKDWFMSQLKKFKIKEDMTLSDFFNQGLNEGTCGYTSMILSLFLDDCFIVSGINKYLKGTKNSPKGEHTWIECGEKIYDPSLELISFPNDLGYKEITRISKQELLLSPNYFILNSYVKNQMSILQYEKIISNIMDYITETNVKKMCSNYLNDEIIKILE